MIACCIHDLLLYTVDDCTVECYDPEFEDRQREKIKARNFQSLDGAASYPQENHALHSRSKPYTKEKNTDHH